MGLIIDTDRVACNNSGMITRADNLISVNQAAKILGVTGGRVRQLLHADNELRAVKVGNSWCFRRVDVVKFAKLTRKPGRKKKSEN